MRQGGVRFQVLASTDQLIKVEIPGTNCISCHVIVKGPENRMLRTFSVAQDYDGGGTPLTFADMVGAGSTLRPLS